MLRISDKREQKVFTYWLDKQVLKKRGITAVAFKRMCDRGEVPGLEPGSDTVPGGPSNVDGSEQREETFGGYNSNPGSVNAQPGPATSTEGQAGRSPT